MSYQPISGKSINKINNNSLYGSMGLPSWAFSTPTGSGKSASFHQIYANQLMNAMHQMQGTSRILRHMGIDLEEKGRHAISNTYPFEYEKIDYDAMTYEDFLNINFEYTRFKRRLDAEIFRLNKFISHYRKQKNQYKPQKAKFRGGKQIHARFEGYPNEALQKKKREQECNRLDKIISEYKFKLENIEEEHPEWLI
jgi:hypothetical protein